MQDMLVIKSLHNAAFGKANRNPAKFADALQFLQGNGPAAPSLLT
jgi:hypothetical protein